MLIESLKEAIYIYARFITSNRTAIAPEILLGLRQELPMFAFQLALNTNISIKIISPCIFK